MSAVDPNHPKDHVFHVKQRFIAVHDGDVVHDVSCSPVVASAGQGAPPRTGTVCPNRAARPGVAARSAVL